MDGVEVLVMSEATKLPLIQARATRDFKKASLLLVPYAGSLFDRSSEDPKKMDADRKLLDKAMLVHVMARVRCEKPKHATGGAGALIKPESVSRTFCIASPLLEAKKPMSRETCFKNLAPFWAVLRDPAADHNLSLAIEAFDVSGFPPTILKFPTFQRGHKFVVWLPVMRNTRAIRKGEVLTIPFEIPVPEGES